MKRLIIVLLAIITASCNIAQNVGIGTNTPGSGGAGQTYLYNTTGAALIFRNGNPSGGLTPGGGASGVHYGTTSLGGGSGADGIIIVHY